MNLSSLFSRSARKALRDQRKLERKMQEERAKLLLVSPRGINLFAANIEEEKYTPLIRALRQYNKMIDALPSGESMKPFYVSRSGNGWFIHDRPEVEKGILLFPNTQSFISYIKHQVRSHARSSAARAAHAPSHLQELAA